MQGSGTYLVQKPAAQKLGQFSQSELAIDSFGLKIQLSIDNVNC